VGWKRRGRGNSGGFSLVEVIAVLVLTGMMAAIAGSGLVMVVRGYLLARENMAMAQKAQLALSRLSNELMVCYNCIGNSEPIILPFTYSNVIADNRVVDRAGDTIVVNGDPLVDNVSEFSLAYDDMGRVVISFSLDQQQIDASLVFSTRVLPRNSYQ
jgi:prepilin-type N-terminal cleavage/methylation domain-containing protein